MSPEVKRPTGRVATFETKIIVRAKWKPGDCLATMTWSFPGETSLAAVLNRATNHGKYPMPCKLSMIVEGDGAAKREAQA